MTNRIAGCAIRDGIPDFAMRDAQDVQSKQSKRERTNPQPQGIACSLPVRLFQ
jgi:hypothetical protein